MPGPQEEALERRERAPAVLGRPEATEKASGAEEEAFQVQKVRSSLSASGESNSH